MRRGSTALFTGAMFSMVWEVTFFKGQRRSIALDAELKKKSALSTVSTRVRSVPMEAISGWYRIFSFFLLFGVSEDQR